MKKLITMFFLVVVGGLIMWVLSSSSRVPSSESTSAPDLTSEVSNIHVKGIITGINGEQAMVDGPYLVSVQDSDGMESVVSVPSRGFQLCAAKDTTVSPYDLKKGMTIEVNGALTSGGNIVPCESVGHYLRVIK